MSGRRKMTEREVKARLLNKKEERVLEKTFGTLNLEMGFTYNVLSLRVRTVKANYKRLRERADKLKSNLKPDEITMLRQLEEEGKFKPTSSFNVNAAMKIAAAAHRLNMYPEGIKRSKTMLSPRRQSSGEKLTTNRSNTDINLTKKRSNSVTGVFIDVPPPDNYERRNSVDLGKPQMASIRPVSAAVTSTFEKEDSSLDVKKAEVVRPSTSNILEREQTSMSRVSFKSTGKNSSSQDFTAYEATPRDKGRKKSAHDKLLLIDVTDESLDSGRQKIFEDRRHELLQDEHQFAKVLVKRKEDFLERIDTYLEENPPVRFHTPMLRVDLPPIDVNVDSDDDDVMKYSRRRRPGRTYDIKRTYTSEEEYKQQERELWKDMNKTRYLRVPDDMLDLSGVQTLAKDQLKLFRIMQSQDSARLVTKA
ncbi:uncharacterized protein LOC128226825 [Mya arenaria]|uniref:uncharacterized protein LOC128226825 n=1 Tax=Mya arenaria TaxID=6604 RepID=UPI0022E52013|nr:uncharacterized protein LOC128226825 [Mya arenaria]XP_052792855.1 uncharacterized protein LOC128226825 [Mya arenaria]